MAMNSRTLSGVCGVVLAAALVALTGCEPAELTGGPYSAEDLAGTWIFRRSDGTPFAWEGASISFNSQGQLIGWNHTQWSDRAGHGQLAVTPEGDINGTLVLTYHTVERVTARNRRLADTWHIAGRFHAPNDIRAHVDGSADGTRTTAGINGSTSGDYAMSVRWGR